MIDALRWLLGRRGKATVRNVIVRARLCRLLIPEPGIAWKTDGRVAVRAVKAALRRLPTDPEALGRIIHGIGEIAARCNVDLMEPLLDHFRVLRFRIDLRAMLDSAAHVSSIHTPFTPADLGLAQAITRARLDWETFRDTVLRLEHPYDVCPGGRFGLGFAAGMALSIDARALDGWVRSRPNHPVLAIAGRAVVEALFADTKQAVARSLLAARNPTLRCLAAASIVWPEGRQEALWTISDCWQTLVDSGIEPGDALWMAGFRLKDAIHARYRFEHRIEESEAQLRSLERNPAAAHGGSRYAESAVKALQKEVASAAAHLSERLPSIEAMLNEMAQLWPQEGLSDEQMIALENVFVDTPEIRHRLAEKLRHPENRQWLLKKNILQLQGCIGLTKDAGEALAESFLLDERRFGTLMQWAARSLILLHDKDERGIGKRTSDLVAELARTATSLLDEPFIAAHQPMRWQSAVMRSACADLFAMAVATAMPTARNEEVAILKRHAIEHAFVVLRGASAWNGPEPILDHLARAAAGHMSSAPELDDIRRKWISAADLPDFPRALALWSAPCLVQKQSDLAFALFRRVAQLPLSRRSEHRQLERMLCLLDVAIASSWTAGIRNLLPQINCLWDDVYAIWRERLAGRWADTAAMLTRALEKDGPERNVLMTDASFAQSHCRRAIEKNICIGAISLPSSPT